MSNKRKLYIVNDPTTLRIVPELACEIGLNESIMLLQLDFIISIARNEHIGIWNDRRKEHDWCYFSIRDLQEEYFSFWSIATVNRTIQSLISQGLIIEDNFNSEKYDKTRWMALSFEGISRLQSIKVDGYETRSNQNETGRNQNETGLTQNETPIPETSTETSSTGIKTNLNHPNNNIEPNYLEQNPEIGAVDKKTIRGIFSQYLGKDLPDHLYPVLVKKCSERSEVEKIASTLQKKRDKGKVKNPLGILVSNPEAVIESILAGSFYPDSPEGSDKSVESIEEEIKYFETFTGIDMKARSRKEAYQKWRMNWGFDKEMVLKAAELMALYARKSNLEYVDRVLDNWRIKEVRTVKEVEKLITQFKNKNKNEKSPSKSYSEYEIYVPPEVIEELKQNT